MKQDMNKLFDVFEKLAEITKPEKVQSKYKETIILSNQTEYEVHFDYQPNEPETNTKESFDITEVYNSAGVDVFNVLDDFGQLEFLEDKLWEMKTK